MAEDRLSQEGKDESEYPKPQISSRVVQPLASILWKGYGDSLPNVNPLTTSSTGYPGLAACKGLGCGGAAPAECAYA